MNDFSKIGEHDSNFHKLWLLNILATVDSIGKQKMKLAFWIAEHLDDENKLVYTFRRISAETGISLDTVSKTMKLMMEHGFLSKKHSGCYVANLNVAPQESNVKDTVVDFDTALKESSE